MNIIKSVYNKVKEVVKENSSLYKAQQLELRQVRSDKLIEELVKTMKEHGHDIRFDVRPLNTTSKSTS